MKAIITPLLKHELAYDVKSHIFPVLANTYITIGRPIRWGDAADPETQAEIEDAIYTTNYRNQVFRDMIAIKKVAAADTALVIPRVDWITGTKYDEYRDDVELYSYYDQLSIGTANVTGNVAIANTAVYTGNLSIGNVVTIGTETKEIISVNATHLIVNTAVAAPLIDASVIRVDNTYPYFANNFYVRNSKDQVFKCLHNANANSTIEPTIDIDGQLPENPYILTSDNYRWKYLYTIPYGLKQKFFTSTWMPVISDAAVVAGAVDGRIDIVEIIDGGTGYFLDNGESGNVSSLDICTVIGDGTSADITAKVESGVITNLNILNGGSGYTQATITINDPDQLPNSNIAIFDVTISPPGGHGNDPVHELGCFSVMTSVDLAGTENDTIPVGSDSVPFDFRQICLLRDPLLANGDYATGSAYRSTTKLTLTNPGITNYTNDESVYIGSSLSDATLTATVIHWDSANNELFVNNLYGNVVIGSTLTGNVSAATATILAKEDPDILLFSGQLLYIENRSKIVRDSDQTEQIRLTFSF